MSWECTLFMGHIHTTKVVMVMVVVVAMVNRSNKYKYNFSNSNLPCVNPCVCG